MKLDEHDPWQHRLVIGFLGLALLMLIGGTYRLSEDGENVQGYLAVIGVVAMSLKDSVPQRPPWSARKKEP